MQQHEELASSTWQAASAHLLWFLLHCSAQLVWTKLQISCTFDIQNNSALWCKGALKELFTNAAKANARGKAQANIIIIPNCNANSRKSAVNFIWISQRNWELSGAPKVWCITIKKSIFKFFSNTCWIRRFQVFFLYPRSELDLPCWWSLLMSFLVPSNRKDAWIIHMRSTIRRKVKACHIQGLRTW